MYTHQNRKYYIVSNVISLQVISSHKDAKSIEFIEEK